MDLETRIARLEKRMRWWPITIGLALAAGVSLGSRARAEAPAKSLVLVDGDHKVTLEPAGLHFEGPDEHAILDPRKLDLAAPGGSATLTTERLTIASKAQRAAVLSVEDSTGQVALFLSNDAVHRLRAIASPAATELHVESDRTKVDIHAANDARVSATGGGADAEISIDNGTPCWMLAPAVAGKAQRTCNTAK